MPYNLHPILLLQTCITHAGTQKSNRHFPWAPGLLSKKAYNEEQNLNPPDSFFYLYLMQSREHKLVITEKVLSRITSRDPGRLCMVMLTEAGFSNASVTAHCWLNELLEAGTEYLMSLAWCEQLLWQEKGLLSSVEALNNSAERSPSLSPFNCSSAPGQSLWGPGELCLCQVAGSLAQTYLHMWLPGCCLAVPAVCCPATQALCSACRAHRQSKVICGAFVSNIHTCQGEKTVLKTKPLS